MIQEVRLTQTPGHIVMHKDPSHIEILNLHRLQFDQSSLKYHKDPDDDEQGSRGYMMKFPYWRGTSVLMYYVILNHRIFTNCSL